MHIDDRPYTLELQDVAYPWRNDDNVALVKGTSAPRQRYIRGDQIPVRQLVAQPLHTYSFEIAAQARWVFAAIDQFNRQ